MRLSSLSRIEQQLLACIRAACFPAEAAVCQSAPQLCSAVNNMAVRLTGARLSIWRPGSIFMSQDEVFLIAFLAAMQRRDNRTLRSGLPPDLIEASQHCAATLAEAGVRLPARIWLHLDIIAHPERHSMTSLRSGNYSLRVGEHSMAAAALTLVRERKLVSTREFKDAGISRQHLSLLCKKGVLKRARHGWYSASTGSVVCDD